MGVIKAGDRVRRVATQRGGSWRTCCGSYRLPVGAVCTVSGECGGMLWLREMPNDSGGWARDYFELVTDAAPLPEQEHDAVKRPKHYILLDTEAITLIASGLTQEQFYGYCLGNAMKYRLRAGKKDNTLQDIGKAEEYELLYEQYKHLCRKGGTHHG